MPVTALARRYWRPATAAAAGNLSVCGTTILAGQAAHFTGSEMLSHATNSQLTPAHGSMAYACWVNLDALTNGQWVMGKYGATTWEWFLFYSSTFGFKTGFNLSDGNHGAFTGTVAAGGWHHVMFIWATNTGSLYLDGSLTQNDTSMSNNWAQGNTTLFSAGAQATADFIGLHGILDQVILWSNVSGLTAAAVYNGGAGVTYATAPAGVTAGAAGWWELDEVTGSASWCDSLQLNSLAATGTLASVAGKV